MLGFDALGRLALGQLPRPPQLFGSIQQPPVAPVKSAIVGMVLGSSMALLATNHAPFVNNFNFPINPVRLAPPDQFHVNPGNFPNPAPIIPVDYNKPAKPPASKEPPTWALNINLFTNPVPFNQYDWNKPHQVPNYPIGKSSDFNLNLSIPARPVIPNELGFSRFPKLRTTDQFYPNLPLMFGRPFVPVDYSRPHAVLLAPIPVNIGFQITRSGTIPDTHDGVFVKRKSKRRHDLIADELAEKAARRAALELAIYGPEVTYEPQPAVFEAPKPAPDVTELAKVIALAQAEQAKSQRAQSDQDEETDLEAILREIL